MELGFDHTELRGLTEGEHNSHALQSPLDWAGLKARFMAVHALRLALTNAPAPPGGSFMEDAAGFLCAAREGSTLVNPKDSANGKGLAGIDTYIVGTTPQIDDRGMI